jgi:hypothetical protein
MKTKLLLIISTLFLLFFFYACSPGNTAISSDDDSDEVEMATPEDEVVTAAPEDETAEPDRAPRPNQAPEENKPSKLEKYDVVLEVTKEIDAKKSGMMKIWIGDPTWKIEPNANFAHAEQSIPASIGQYAKITPIVSDFDVKPDGYGCMKIDPSGSSVIFELFPKKAKWGETHVSALIELYEGADCSGTPVLKNTNIITVKVKIKLPTLIGDLFEVFWKQLLAFLGAILGAIGTYFVVKFKKKAKIKDQDEE